MWRSLLTWAIAAFCCVLGVTIATYKHTQLAFPLVPDASINSWYVELHTTLQSPPKWRRDKKEAIVSIIEPRNSGDFASVDRQSIARDFGEQRSTETGQIRLDFTKRYPDNSEAIHLRFLIYELNVNDATSSKKRKKDARYNDNPYSKRNRLSNPEEDIAALYESIDAVVADALEKSASPKSFVSELWKILNADKNTARYLRQLMQADDNASLIVMLSQVAGYTARAANGLALGEQNLRSAQLLRWVELSYKNKWRRFDVETGDYIPKSRKLYRWWSGDAQLVDTSYFTHHVTSISVKPNVDSSLTRALWQARDKQPIAYRFALQTLPLEQQLVMQVLLLMPVGALLVSFLRQVVGMRTFGTFMPVLVALAFRETGLAFGIMFFLSVVTIGLILRSYLNALRLLLVPRLSTVLTVVVALLMFVMLAFKDSSIPLGVSIALFPVVIITMFIERMSTVWEERGARNALIACVGSVIVACIVYLVIINPIVKHAMFTFPELLLLVFAGCLLLGRYNGYKLTEYVRFHQLKRALKQQEKDDVRPK